MKLCLEEGFPREFIAQEMGVSMAAIDKCFRLYRLHGEEGLKDRTYGQPKAQLPAATHQLNHRRLRSLAERTPCHVYLDPARRLQFHGASRQKIFRAVFSQFWQCIECMPQRHRHTIIAAWRLVVESWLRRQGWISVTDKSNTNVSTDS